MSFFFSKLRIGNYPWLNCPGKSASRLKPFLANKLTLTLISRFIVSYLADKRDPVKNDIGSEFPIAVPYPDDSDEADVQENELVNDGEESDDEDEEAAFKAEGKLTSTIDKLSKEVKLS